MSHPTPSVLICPGQGAQRAGGVTDLAPQHDDLPSEGRRAFALASEVVGCNLWQIGQSQDPQDEVALRRPSLLQPFLIAWAMAEQSLLDERLGPFDFVSGHSSGMNTALVCAGAVDLEAALRFAWQCGREMDRDCDEQPGGLLALVGADRAAAESIAAESGSVLANHNAPDQTVLGGAADALQRAAILAPTHGVQAVALRVAGAFHTPAFAGSDGRNHDYIENLPIAERFTPIIGNRCGQVIETDDDVRAELREQYVRPVEWLATLETLRSLGVRRFVTLGPGNVMAGLVRRFGKTSGERFRIERATQLRAKES